MERTILRSLLMVFIGMFAGTTGVSVWFATTSDIALVALVAVLGSLLGLVGIAVCVLARLAVVHTEN